MLVSSAKDMDGLKNLVTMLGDALNCEDRTKQATDWYMMKLWTISTARQMRLLLYQDEMPEFFISREYMR